MRTTGQRMRCIVSSGIMALVLLGLLPARAQTRVDWSPPGGQVGGEFHDPDHWTQGFVPAGTNYAVFSTGIVAGQNNVITFERGATNAYFATWTAYGTVKEFTLDLDGHTYSLASSDNQMSIGSGTSDGGLTVRILDGRFETHGSWRVGVTSNREEREEQVLIISGANTFWHDPAGGAFRAVGNGGTGRLIIEGGAKADLSSFFLGRQNGHIGYLEIVGPNTAVTNSGYVDMGWQSATQAGGAGYITVRDGAHWQANDRVRSSNGHVGELQVLSGATVHANALELAPVDVTINEEVITASALLHISGGTVTAGSLALGARSTFKVTLHADGTNALLTTAGNATLTDAVFELALDDGFDAATDGSVTFKILDIGGARTGSFLDLDDQEEHILSAVARAGTAEETTYYFQVNYDNPGSPGFSLTVIPEPHALLLLLLGLGLVRSMRRRGSC